MSTGLSAARARVRKQQDTVKVYVGCSKDSVAESQLIHDKFIDLEGFQANRMHPDATAVAMRQERILLIPTQTGSVPDVWLRVLARFSPMKLQYMLVVPDDLPILPPWSVRLSDPPEAYANMISRALLERCS